ncbi:nucleotidyl transferase AbiEii/AbiGii toxin family protein [Patescibacteria group bacterium]|nr:nucleotidyl transferase AbiEii/AbiGii toxin family protein [Patescibacteria group bacterium]
MRQIFWNTIDDKRKELLKGLEFLDKFGFYLAGGTALALQLGHRTSEDFDFYSRKDFDVNKLVSEIKKSFPKVKVNIPDENNLFCEIDGIELSFFIYEYDLLKDLIDLNFVKLASVEDIGAMKCIAVVQRGTKRDFYDVYYLLKKMSLEKLFGLIKKKYFEYDIYNVLTALLYFDDAQAEPESSRFVVFDKSLSWENVKKEIEEKVKEYRLGK